MSDTDGQVLKGVGGLKLGQSVNISFSDGEAKCKVEEIKTK